MTRFWILLKERVIEAEPEVIMNVNTGEILASGNFPEYESGVMTSGFDTKKINEWVVSKNHPFLNRVVSGLLYSGIYHENFYQLSVF